jgi:hypothetical protein
MLEEQPYAVALASRLEPVYGKQFNVILPQRNRKMINRSGREEFR